MGKAKLQDPQHPGEAGVIEIASQLRCWQGHARPMASTHRHDDIEVNLVSTAPLRYLFNGTPVDIHPGEIAVFWAALPHRLIDSPENWDSHVCWLHIPLRVVLTWGLAESSLSPLLHGAPLLWSVADARRPERADFAQWSQDLASTSPELHTVAVLEIEAMIRRLLHQRPSTGNTERQRADTSEPLRHATAMASYATTHFREPITAADIADIAHLHPGYAMTVFRRVLGTTLGTYLTQCRLAEAQRLLITTDATMSQIASASGFTSHSNFYATFGRVCGQTPGSYRRTYRQT